MEDWRRLPSHPWQAVWVACLYSRCPDRERERFHRAHEMFVEIENCKKPVIAAINGVTIGAGLELAMLCDLRIASELSFFSLPEAKPELSIIPGLGGTQRLPRIIGATRAKEMLFLGKMIRAETALEWGLINQIVSHKEVLKQTIALAKTLLERDARALKEMKKCINYAVENDILKGIEYEVCLFAEMMRLKLASKSSE